MTTNRTPETLPPPPDDEPSAAGEEDPGAAADDPALRDALRGEADAVARADLPPAAHGPDRRP